MAKALRIIELMRECTVTRSDVPQGVVDLNCVLGRLLQECDLEQAKRAVFEMLADPRVAYWQPYALDLLRLLAGQSKLSVEECRQLLALTTGCRDLDEYYKTISVLASSREAADAVVEFVADQVGGGAVWGGPDLALFALYALMRNGVSVALPFRLLETLSVVIAEEPDSRRREQRMDVLSDLKRWKEHPDLRISLDQSIRTLMAELSR